MAQQIADLHIHSHYSRATSKNSNIEGLYYWAKIKGINILGTGDFTHPGWLEEMKDKLEMTDSGLYKLKDGIASDIDRKLPKSVRDSPIRFVPSVEISNIYSKGGKTRRLHNCIVVPNFSVASYINSRLSKIGNLQIDGRPILGMDSKNLLEIVLQSHDNSLFFPAHIWTPWFAMFGSKSGFDSIKEAFEDLAPEIKAVETGLSADPYMNWRIDELQKVTLVSNSDAHSPQKLGREANIINAQLNYIDVISAIKTNDKRMVGTIEFFPQEGKYHFDGHRACGFSCSPAQTKKLKKTCPKCGKPLVVGVDYRVDELSNHPEKYIPVNPKKVEYIIPLPEIISEMEKVGVSSKKVQTEYEKIYTKLGCEFDILRKLPIETIQSSGFVMLGEAIDRMRRGAVKTEPGFDGVFGKIRLYSDEAERTKTQNQLSLL